MFAGIVTAIGEIVTVEEREGLRRFRLRAPLNFGAPAIGASVACAGICLTAVEAETNGAVTFVVEAGPETLRLTTAGGWSRGGRLNLERSLRIGDELGGHLVTGHIDGLAAIVARREEGDTVAFEFAAPPGLARFIAAKGSIALDGTSLTVNAVDGPRFGCHLIPHTLAVTTWSERRVGDRVNLEVDLIARYADRLLRDR